MEKTDYKTIKQCYGGEELDQIFCYFMKTILRLQNSGIERLPVENDFSDPVKTFLTLAVELIMDGQPKEVSELVLNAEYDAILSKQERDGQELLPLLLIRELSLHIHYDQNYYDYMLGVSNLWQNAANEYAVRTFYPNLPEEIKEKHGVNDLLKYTPADIFRMDDF